MLVDRMSELLCSECHQNDIDPGAVLCDNGYRAVGVRLRGVCWSGTKALVCQYVGCSQSKRNRETLVCWNQQVSLSGFKVFIGNQVA
jgi:hypothetical protein